MIHAVAADPCSQRDQRKVAARRLGKASAHQPGAVFLRNDLRGRRDDFRIAVDHALLIAVHLPDDVFKGRLILHVCQHLRSGIDQRVFPSVINHRRRIARVDDLRDILKIGGVRFGAFQREQA